MAKIKLVTHNAKFHTDDVFAIATLFIALGKENCEVIRTRDEALIAAADYVVDVGNVYDESRNRFDHHQIGGAGERENGIPYASFGLVWKKLGEQVCGSAEIAQAIDRAMVQAVDAGDNGYDLITFLTPDARLFDINSIVNQYRPTWKEEEGDWDERFTSAVLWAEGVLKRQIKMEQDYAESRAVILSAYESVPDKRLVVIPEQYDVGREAVVSALADKPEALYAILFRKDSGDWQVVAMSKDNTFEPRKPLPEAWAEKIGRELEDVTGVNGAHFCHRNRFMCLATSKEGALKLAKLALNS